MTPDPFADVDIDALPPAAPCLFDAARSQFLHPPAADVRRKWPRFYIAAEALARPVTVDGTPTGDAFRGVVADLSNGGLRILHASPLSNDHLAVRLGLWDESVVVIVRVIRTTKYEYHFAHSGPFISPLAEIPATDLGVEREPVLA